MNEPPMTNPTITQRSPFDDAMPIPQILFSFRGRVPRKVFWLYGVLGLTLASAMLEMLFGIVRMPQGGVDIAVNLLLVWPFSAIVVKRFHDRDKSGWWALLYLLPAIGWVWALVENGCFRGTPGPNRFGVDLTDEF